MKKSIIGGSLAFFLLTACQNQSTNTTQTDDLKIVSLNGSVTETICALGLENNIVGVDVTSVYPASMKEKAKVGHGQKITAEGIMSLQPNLVIGTELDMTDHLKQQLKEANVKTLYFDRKYTLAETQSFILALADSVGKLEEGEKIVNQINIDIADAQKITERVTDAPKVLFIYARGAGSLMVAGDDTPYASIIELAGGKLAIKGFEGFKPLTTEAIVEANPDVILLFDSGFEALGGHNGVLATPGIDLTNAGRNNKIVHMDGGLLTNFGPRVGLGIKELATLIHQ